MIFGAALRHLLVASLVGLRGFVHAEPLLPEPASDAKGGQIACETASFDAKESALVVPPGAIPPQGVVVRALLEFSDPKSEPGVTITFNSGDPAFADAVIAAAKEYRLACAKKGNEPLRYTQEVQFVGTEARKVVVGRIRPVSEDLNASPDAATCLKGADGKPRLPNRLPWDPVFTGSRLVQPAPVDLEPRTVIVKLTFSGPDAAPETTVLFSRAEKSFERSVLDYVAEYRWACMRAGDPPEVAVQVFRYVADRNDPVPPKITLQQFLGSVDKIAEQRVRFDFTTMGCPFSFRMTYLQPFSSSNIAEVGDTNSNRREFVHWLRNVTVRPELNPDNKLVDRDFEVSVPCLVLDLT